MKLKIKQIEIEIPTKATRLIDLCYQHNLPINFGCRIGMCGTCIINIANNTQNVSALSALESDFGLTNTQRMACQCIITGDLDIE